MTSKVSGGCFCGAIRYEAKALPLGSMICHCQSCRRIAGAPAVAWVTFPKAELKFSSPPTEFFSSAGVRRTHCAKCGTSLSYEGTKFPTEIDLVTVTLDDPNAFPPTHHSWVSHDLAWIRFGDGLPTFPESRNS